jgi:hypothetical protein
MENSRLPLNVIVKKWTSRDGWTPVHNTIFCGYISMLWPVDTCCIRLYVAATSIKTHQAVTLFAIGTAGKKRKWKYNFTTLNSLF